MVVFEFFTTERCTAANIHSRVRIVYRGGSIGRSSVRRCVNTFKSAQTSIDDIPRSGRPPTLSDWWQLVASWWNDPCKLGCHSTWNCCKFEFWTWCCAKDYRVSMMQKNVCQMGASIVITLSPTLNDRRLQACSELLSIFQVEEQYFFQFLTKDVAWVYQYDLETKRQSM